MTLTLESEDGAKRLLQCDSFIAEWQELYSKCVWATPFQTPQACKIWYTTYQHLYRPIIAYWRDESVAGASLAHLIALAHNEASDELVVCGGHQAEFQCWISDSDYFTAFLSELASAIRRRVTVTKLRLRYLPSGLAERLARADCRRALHDSRCNVIFTLVDDPVVKIDSADPPWNSMSKKGNKSKLAKLNQIGLLNVKCFSRRFYRNDLEAGEALNAIMPFYDLRQGAMNGVAPFHDDARKFEYHLKLLNETDDFQIFVLFAGKEVMGGLMGPVDGMSFGNGIICHSPFHSKYSPGKFLIFYALQALNAQGIKTFDLTPGGDAWKWRHANQTVPVAEMYLYFNRLHFLQHKALGVARDLAKRLLRRKMNIPRTLEEFVAGDRSAEPSSAPVKRGGQTKSHEGGFETFKVLRSVGRELRHSASAERCQGKTSAREIEANCIAHFLTYEDHPALSRQALFQEVIDQYEFGSVSMTEIQEGRLARSAWLSFSASAPQLADCVPASLGSKCILWGLRVYDRQGCGDRSTGQSSLLRQWLADLVTKCGEFSEDDEVTLVIPRSNPDMLEAAAVLCGQLNPAGAGEG